MLRLLDPKENDLRECSIYFRTAAARFKLIDDSKIKTIFVRYGEGDKLIDLLKARGPDRQILRQLQRYTVNVYNDSFSQMFNQGAVEEVYSGIFALVSDSEYSDRIGLTIDVEFEPESYIQ